MQLNFAAALATLGPDAAFRIANVARPAGDYVWAQFLPEQRRASYHVSSGTMTIRPTMAGLVGMDSPYPPGGLVDISTFMEQTAKIANDIGLSEKALRELQALLQMTAGSTEANAKTLAEEALNFLNKVVVQAHLDTFEWMRGQALATGAINWVMNDITLAIDYGIPAANLLANNTGTAAYYNTASNFWKDIRTLRKLLKEQVRAFVAHPDLISDIVYNDANKLKVIGEDGLGGFTVQRVVGSTERPSGDVRDTVQLIAYAKEGEVLDPANPGKSIKVPFCPRTKLVAIGRNTNDGYRVGDGATADPLNEIAIGYTHIAPTVEGGAPGRWARLFTPEGQPWSLHGQGVTNGLPVIENAELVAVASSDLSS